MNKQRLFCYLQFWRCIPADLLYLTTKQRMIIDADLSRFKNEIPFERLNLWAFNYAILFRKNFRNILYYRTSDSRVLRIISRAFLPQLDSLEIQGDIGKGFCIYHNYGVIHPYIAGENFTVHHGVTIGKGKPSEDNCSICDPCFGNDVEVMSGAIVFGGIKVGNNVLIGAGSVVNKDVPDNCTVVGNPMRIISNK